MSSSHVRGYQDHSGGSHMFALWTGRDEPDEDDDEAWTWVRADKILWATRGMDGRTMVVFDGGNSLKTDATPEDIRWAVDHALNGGVHRTRPMMNLGHN